MAVLHRLIFGAAGGLGHATPERRGQRRTGASSLLRIPVSSGDSVTLTAQRGSARLESSLSDQIPLYR